MRRFPNILLLSLICMTGFAKSGSGHACELHDQRDKDAKAVQISPARLAGGPILFSPDAPDTPTHGAIWIDARNGAQHVFDGVNWVERRMKISRPPK